MNETKILQRSKLFVRYDAFSPFLTGKRSMDVVNITGLY